MKINQILLGFIFLVFTGQLYAQSEIELSKKEALAIGEKIAFKSKILDENREINIYLSLIHI